MNLKKIQMSYDQLPQRRSLTFMDMCCGYFGGHKWQIKNAAKNLAAHIQLSIDNGDKFYSPDGDYILASFPMCAAILSQKEVMECPYFVAFAKEKGLVIKQHSPTHFLVDYPPK